MNRMNIRLAGIVFLVSALMVPRAHAQTWQSIGGNNQRNGLSRITGPDSAAVLWTLTNAGNSNLGNAVYTYGDRFVTSRSVFSPVYEVTLECRDLMTGSLHWDKKMGPGSRLFAMGFQNYIYAHDYFTDTLYALDPADGAVIWARKEPFLYGGSNGMLFACDGDPVIRGKRIDSETGSTVWQNNYIVPVMPDAGYCLYGDTYYHYTGSIVTPKQLIAIDLNTGLTKYLSNDLPGDGDQEIPLTAGPDGRIYIWRDGGLLYCFSDDGTAFTEEWTYTPDAGTGTYGNIGFDLDGNLYLSDGQVLKRLDRTTGTVMNTTTFPLAATVTFNARVATGKDGTVYVSNCDVNGTYYAFTPDLQTVIWQRNVPYNTYCGPNLDHEGIMVVTGAGTTITALQTPHSLPPVADFTPHNIRIYEGQTVQFTNFTSYGYDSVAWNFPGGLPSSSSAPAPLIQYDTPGIYDVSLQVTHNGFGSDELLLECCVEVMAATGIPGCDELPLVYPNPFSDRFYLRLPESGNTGVARVFDFTGKMIREIQVDRKKGDKVMIDPGPLPAGVYIVRITEHPGESKSLKVMKSR